MYSKSHPQPGAHERSAFIQPRSTHFKGNRPAPQEAPKNLASALKVKNFRRLLEVAGEENLAVALDLTLHRVKELAEGVNFSNETTHHIETTLALSSGFLDQVNPVLTSEDADRLKSPKPMQDLFSDPPPEKALVPATTAVPAQTLAEPDPAGEPAPASSPSLTAEVKDSAPEAPVAGASFLATALAPASQSQPAQPSPLIQQPALEEKTMGRPSKQSVAQAASAAPAQSQGPANEEDALRETRRLNLLTLTAQPGAKSQLARLTNLSAANISHRLHGNKIFDKETADFFCKQLGLPEGWFEAPKSREDVPETTVKLLGDKASSSGAAEAPKARGPRKSKTSAATPATVVAAAPQTAPVAAAPSASKTKKAATGAVALSLSSAALGKSPESAQPRPVEQPQAPAVHVAAAPVAASTPAPAPVPAPAPSPVVKAAAPAPNAATPVASARLAQQALAGDTVEVGPIAEALVRTLASKSRAGALSEARALELLVEIAAL